MLETRDKTAKERCMDIYEEENGNVKRFIYSSKREINELVGRKMNQNLEGSWYDG